MCNVEFFLRKCYQRKYSFCEIFSTKKIYTYKDSLYFRDLTEIIFHNSRYYIADYSNSRVLVLDSLLNYVYSIGSLGQGPGEFRGVKHIGINRDTLYGVDDGNVRVNVFTVAGKYIRVFSLPDRYYTVCKHAIDDAGNFYFSSPMGSKKISKYNFNNKNLFRFGDFLPFTGQKFEKENQLSHILHSGGNIYAVMQADPIVDVYDTMGRRLVHFEIPTQPFQSRIEYRESEYRKNPINRSKTYKIFQDAAIHGNKLYLLYITNDDNQGALCNKILVVDFSNNIPSIEKIIKLKSIWYLSFAIYGSKLLAFNSTEAVIESYVLQEPD